MGRESSNSGDEDMIVQTFVFKDKAYIVMDDGVIWCVYQAGPEGELALERVMSLPL